jgi:nitrous oxidase accessory protein NosD
MKYTSIFALTLLAAAPALAQNDRTWVSQRSGNDANNCLFATPCLTFQGAYAKTNSGGIILAMDAGGYGTVSISSPIIIDGNGVGAVIEAVSADGVSLNNAGLVEIRNLAIHVPASCGCNGITAQNSSVSIENVSIAGAPSKGVYVQSGSTATIHGLTVTGAGNYGIYVTNSTATISDSLIRFSFHGIYVFGGNVVTQALIERSKMISNTTGLSVQYFGAATTARISDCVITGNSIGTETSGGGQIITFRNNTWAGNISDGTTPFSVSLK